METKTFTVDYGLTLPEMIKLCRYKGVVKEITPDRFPLSGNGKVILEPKLFNPRKCCDGCPSPVQLIEMMRKEGFRPAKIEELVAYSYAMPKLVRRLKFSIVALGSIVRVRYPATTPEGIQVMPSLGTFHNSFESMRETFGLSLDWVPLYGFPHSRPLGVREVQPKS